MPKPTLRISAYARVSSDQQTKNHTIASQVEAIKERVGSDGLALDPEMLFCDDGFSGESLQRPALERLRDQIAAGAVDRVDVHSPDRLARKYAYQVLLVDELRRAGTEVVFLNHAVDETPEGELVVRPQNETTKGRFL